MIITITGMPGCGKTYLAVKLIHDAWKQDPERKIFTNFPVVFGDKSTMKWSPEYTSENLQNSLIVVDEAYRDYNSRKSLRVDGLSEDDHLAFATNRHNENTFIFISQNLNRLDTVIREISEIWWVTKMALPSPRHFFEFDRWRPLWIKVEMYDCLDSFKLKAMIGKGNAYRKKRHLFKMKIARMYDTHFFGDTTEEAFISEPWFEIKKEEKHGILYRTKHYVSGLPDSIRQYTRSLIRIRLYNNRYWNRLWNFGLSRLPNKKKRDYDLFEPLDFGARLRRIARRGSIRNLNFYRKLFLKLGINFDHFCDDMGFT